jgi:hypothetical protein
MFQKLHGVVPFFFLFILLMIPENNRAQSDEDLIKQYLNGNLVVTSQYQKEIISNYLDKMTPHSKIHLSMPDNIRSILFSEDFTGQVLPAGWTNVSHNTSNNVWLFDNPEGRNITGTFDSDFAIFDSDHYGPGASQNASLTTLAIDVSSLPAVVLGFYQQFRALAPSYGVVQVSNDSTSWVTLDSITVNTGYPNPPVYTEYDVTAIAAGQPEVYFRWTYVGSFAFYWAIDNVVVYEPEPYPNPAILVSPLNSGTDIAVDATLNWTADGGAAPTGYRIYFGTDGEGITPPTNIENNYDLGLVTTYTPDPVLAFNTTYYWMIVPYNSEGDALDNVIWSFTTIEDSVVSVFPYSKDFEGTFPPTHWNRFLGLLADPSILIQSTSGWIQDNWRHISSPVNKAARVNVYGSTARYWLMTPQIDLGTGIDYQLEFDLTLNAHGTSNPPATTGADDRFAVIISTDGGTTWTSSNILRVWDNQGSSYVYNNINYLGEHQVINITGYSGVVMIGFYGESTVSNADNDLMIDNVEISISASGQTPIFTIEPTSLDFGSVTIGNDEDLQATVSNTGDEDLVISDIISSDAQFTFTPATFPVTITPGNNQVFNVTFTPANPGTQSAMLEFTHNAEGSPTSYPLQGVGVDAGPIFIVDPESLDFGNINLGSSSDLTVTVSNLGTLNPLTISSAIIAETEFTVDPLSATIPAGGNQEFTVTFTPSAALPYTGTLVFTDNAPGSPHTVSLAGTGYIPPDVTGLIFEQDTVIQLEDESYIEEMQLKNLAADAHAIQFKLLVNTETGDNTILTFQKIRKGPDVSDAGWVLDYNVFRGPITPNGASVDTIFVLLYNLNQNMGLQAGDYDSLLEVQYRISKLPALQDSVNSSIRITNAEASTYEGNPIDITPSPDDMIVIAQNRISALGDVNGDGYLDILDLILVVDHIVGSDSLSGDAFTRADIAPWPAGTQTPNPDGVVNVQDLSLIQNIILTGIYPDGSAIKGGGNAVLPKTEGDADVNVIFYIGNEGISVYLDSRIDIRGAQIEFGNLSNKAEDMVINTDLGQGYYLKVDDLLRTVMYDRLANKYIDAGKHFMADMPFRISNPEEVSPEKMVLVDINKQKVENLHIEIIYGNAPSLPLDFILFQNYPNPFNPNTTVKFQVPKTSSVAIKIYDMLGQEVRTLFDEQVMRGTYAVQWDGMNDAGLKMSSGTYIYRMKAGEFVQSKKMILLK